MSTYNVKATHVSTRNSIAHQPELKLDLPGARHDLSCLGALRLQTSVATRVCKTTFVHVRCNAENKNHSVERECGFS